MHSSHCYVQNLYCGNLIKMKDDPDFNIRFVSLIEAKPCLYDRTRSDYSNKNIQDLAWEQIAKGLEATVAECKERWKNLRGSYTRHLKYNHAPAGFAAKKKKPYYLAEYMAFLQPYTKSRKMKSNVTTSLPSQSKDYTITDFEDRDSDFDNEGAVSDFQSEVGMESENQLHSPSTSHQSTNYTSQRSLYNVHNGTPSTNHVKKKSHRSNPLAVSLEDVNKSAMMQYFQSRQASMEKDDPRRQFEDPDISFLMSLLPDMKKMDERQKRRFKISILSTADNILNEIAHESESSSMNRETN